MLKSKFLKILFFKKKIKKINKWYRKNLYFNISIKQHLGYYKSLFYFKFLREHENIPNMPLAFSNLQTDRILGTLNVLFNKTNNFTFKKTLKKANLIYDLELILNNINFLNTYKSFNQLFNLNEFFKKPNKHIIIYNYLKFHYLNIIYQSFHGWFFNTNYYIFLKNVNDFPFFKYIHIYNRPGILKRNYNANKLSKWIKKNKWKKLNYFSSGFFYKFLDIGDFSGHEYNEKLIFLKYNLK